MNQYYICFFNHHNFGDDLFIYCITRLFPDVTFHINGWKKDLAGVANIDNLKIHYDHIITKKINGLLRRIYGRKDYLLHIRARECLAVVYLGGSLFIEPDQSYLEQYYLNNVRRHIDGKEFYLIGTNFGPYYSQSFLEHFLKEFSTYNLISCRDKATYSLFSSLSNIQYAPDIVFSIRDWFIDMRKENSGYVLFSLIGDTSICNGPSYRRQIVTWVREYIDRGYRVILLSMCEEQGDLAICNDIANEMNSPEVLSVVSYEDDLLAIIQCIASAEYVIGTRFHSVITSLALDVPVVPVIYSNKTANMLKDCDFSGFAIDIKQISKYGFDDVDQNRVNGYHFNAQQYAVASKRHFSFIERPIKS